jgi:hypothetical protein
MYHDVPSLATYQTLSNTFAQQDANAFCGGTLTLACLQGLTAAQVFANERDFGVRHRTQFRHENPAA